MESFKVFVENKRKVVDITTLLTPVNETCPESEEVDADIIKLYEDSNTNILSKEYIVNHMQKTLSIVQKRLINGNISDVSGTGVTRLKAAFTPGSEYLINWLNDFSEEKIYKIASIYKNTLDKIINCNCTHLQWI